MSDVVGGTSSLTASAAPRHPDDREGRDLPPLPGAWEGGLAALSQTGYLAPLCGQVVAVLLYPLLPARAGSSSGIPDMPIVALVVAVAVTIIVWALEFRLGAPMTSSLKAQPRFYSELLEQYQKVRDRWKILEPKAEPVDMQEVRTELDWPDRALIGTDGRPALRWALAYGYVSVLRSVHRVDEALIFVESRERVLSDASDDDASLDRSTITTQYDLRKAIGDAKAALRGDAQAASDPKSRAPARAPDGKISDREAREKLREVRHAIHTFRDDARDGVIRARNRLLVVIFVVSALTFLLLGLAEASGVPAICLTSVAALYLVGAIVGCFNTLRIEASRSSAEEDFGFFQAHLEATLLMSGLAAVGGVYLVAALPALLPGLLAASTFDNRQIPSLPDIFDLRLNTGSLLYAAIFGLVPQNLTKLLFGAADKLQTDLLASRPTNSNA